MRRYAKKLVQPPELDPAVVGSMTLEMIRDLLSHGQKDMMNTGILLGASGADPEKSRLVLAQHEEAVGRLGIAGQWYRAIDRDWHDPMPLRRFLIRHGGLKELLERFGKKVTPEELRIVGRHHLRHKSIGPEYHLQTAFDAFRRAKFSKGVSAVLRQAIREANVKVAERAAKHFYRRLSEREIYQLALAMIGRDPNAERTIDFVIANGLQRKLGRKLLDAILHNKENPSSIGFLDRTAEALGQKLTRKDLEHLFFQPDSSHLYYTVRLAIAERLAVDSPSWRRAVPGLVKEARKWSLAWGYARSAEKYGQQCGQPLTAEELIAYLDHWRKDDRYRDELAFAIDLAATRIFLRLKLNRVEARIAAA